MEVPGIGGRDRKTLVILGAGATRGASFVATDAAVAPPLDADFFQILQMSDTGRGGEARELIDHVRTVYGPGLTVGLETVFNNLDAARTFHETFRIGRGRHLQRPARLIDALRIVLPGLLGETISGNCDFHKALAERLWVGDVVVSLNYDCVVDVALSQHAGFRFDPERGGYGIEVASGSQYWRRAGRGKRAQGSILLLKLHGSLNWQGPTMPLHLREDPYQPVADGVIAPPLTNKPVTDEPFRTIWTRAREAVRAMRRLVVVGYSLPDADGLVRALLTTDLSNDLEEILLVDPSRDTRTRHIEFFSRVAPQAKVFVFSTTRQFATVLAP
jgi:hypothetical protein